MSQSNSFSSKAKRITLVIGSLGLGGAERNLLRLAEGLATRDYCVSLITLDGSTENAYTIPAGIRTAKLSRSVYSSPRWFHLASQWRKYRALRNVILSDNSDVVISYIDTCNIEVLLSLVGAPAGKIVSERIDWRHHNINLRWKFLRRLLYPTADRVVVVAMNLAERARAYFPRWKTAYIPNAVPDLCSTKPVRQPWMGQNNIVAMGRLVEQKRFDLLIRAFGRITDKHPSWHLTILGEGELRQNLERLCRELGIREKVSLPGNISPPFPTMKACDLFILSSAYEAFPNALAEAMACGLPVISFDCPSGPSDIIRDGIDGVLVPCGDLEALVSAMDRLMRDPQLRKQLAANAPQVSERFAPDRILDEWCTLIEDVAGAHQSASQRL